MKNKYTYFTEVEKLKEFEKISNRVSEKYVPIYTSKVISSLEPDFKFSYGRKFSNTQHLVVMSFDEDSKIMIRNSYDRSKAFSFHLISNNIQIPLNLEKQVHIGKNAENLSSDYKINKNNLSRAIFHAKNTIENLKRTLIAERVKRDLIPIIFESAMKRKGFEKLDLELEPHIKTVYDFINRSIDKMIEGEYNVSLLRKNGETSIRKGIKVKSNFRKIQVMNKVFNYIKEKMPEIEI